MDNLDSNSRTRPAAKGPEQVTMLEITILHIITSRHHAHQVEILTEFYLTAREQAKTRTFHHQRPTLYTIRQKEEKPMINLIQKSNPQPIPYTITPMLRTLYTYEITGLTAHAIEVAERSSFYGIHASNKTAADARQAIDDEIRPDLDQREPNMCAWYIQSAKFTRKDRDRAPYRATVIMQVDSLA